MTKRLYLCYDFVPHKKCKQNKMREFEVCWLILRIEHCFFLTFLKLLKILLIQHKLQSLNKHRHCSYYPRMIKPISWVILNLSKDDTKSILYCDIACQPSRLLKKTFSFALTISAVNYSIVLKSISRARPQPSYFLLNRIHKTF